MALPKPEPGLVVRYDYLWAREATAGRDLGKDRPTCLVAASDREVNPLYVLLLPITHSPPSGDTIGIEIPPKVKKAIALDDERSWVIITEFNIDTWPNAGLSHIPQYVGTYSYGFLPPVLFASIKSRFQDLVRAKRSQPVKR